MALKNSQDRVREICAQIEDAASEIAERVPTDLEVWTIAEELSGILASLHRVSAGWGPVPQGTPTLITEAPPCEAFAPRIPTPFREAWNLAHEAGTMHGLEARMDSGRVLLAGNVMFDRNSPAEVNTARLDVLKAITGRKPIFGRCADCDAFSTGIDLARGVQVCDAHKPSASAGQ